jgi:hypothetical protein
VQNQTTEQWKFQVFGTKLVKKIVGCKYGTSKQFSMLQYENDCVAQYHYESAIYESTNDWTCGQDRESGNMENARCERTVLCQPSMCVR